MGVWQSGGMVLVGKNRGSGGGGGSFGIRFHLDS